MGKTVASGFFLTTIVLVVVTVPHTFVTLSVIVYVPAFVN